MSQCNAKLEPIALEDLDQVSGGLAPVIPAVIYASQWALAWGTAILGPRLVAMGAAALGSYALNPGGQTASPFSVAKTAGTELVKAVNSDLATSGHPGDIYHPATMNPDGSINPAHFSTPAAEPQPLGMTQDYSQFAPTAEHYGAFGEPPTGTATAGTNPFAPTAEHYGAFGEPPTGTSSAGTNPFAPTADNYGAFGEPPTGQVSGNSNDAGGYSSNSNDAGGYSSNSNDAGGSDFGGGAGSDFGGGGGGFE